MNRQGELIPDADSLFMRVHRNNTDANGNPIPGAFRNNPKNVPGSGMSTDWEKYSTPSDTQRRGPQPPENYAVIQLNAGQVRKIPGQSVEHTPQPDNRAHTDVFGEKTTEARVQMMKIYELIVPVQK